MAVTEVPPPVPTGLVWIRAMAASAGAETANSATQAAAMSSSRRVGSDMRESVVCPSMGMASPPAGTRYIGAGSRITEGFLGFLALLGRRVSTRSR